MKNVYKVLGILLLVSCNIPVNQLKKNDFLDGGSRLTDGGGLLCPMIVPCGGSIFGKWDIVQVCIEDSASKKVLENNNCLKQIIFSSSGSVQFNSDFTYAKNGSLNIKYIYSQRCLSESDKTCGIDLVGGSVNGDKNNGSCAIADNASTCECFFDSSNQEAPTYNKPDTFILGESVGNVTIISGYNSSSGVIDYCVDNNTLTMYTHSSSLIITAVKITQLL